MNEMEMEALENRMNGMSREEQIFAVQFIDFDILLDEVRRKGLEAIDFKKDMTEMVLHR
jgi:hypothetical protein